MKRWDAPSTFRFVTFSCEGRLQLLGTPPLRDLFVDRLAAARDEHRFRLLAWVVMPEHIHLLIMPQPTLFVRGGVRFLSSPTTGAKLLSALKTSVSERAINRWLALNAPILPRIRQSDGSHSFWLPGGGFDRTIRSDEEYADTLNYIHHNPDKRGLVAHATDWSWSSARWYARLPSYSGPPIDTNLDGPWAPPQEWLDQAVPHLPT